MDIGDIIQIMANSFFGGDTSIAGIVVYIAVIGIVFSIFRKITVALVVALPVTIIFNTMGILSQDVMIMRIIVTVLALAMTARGIFTDE